MAQIPGQNLSQSVRAARSPSANTGTASRSETGSAKDRPLILTYGVEIECVVSMPAAYWNTLIESGDQDIENGWIDEGPVHKKMAQIVRGSTDVEIYAPYDDAESYASDAPNEEYYSRWSIVGDFSIHVRESAIDPDRRYSGAEIISRILRYDDPKSFDEIGTVIRALQNEPLLTLSVNRTTGGHRHLGAMDSSGNNCGFRFSTLRKFCIVVVGFEHLTNDILPADRIVQTGLDMNYIPPSRNIKFANMTVFQHVKKVQACRDMDALHELMRAGRREMAYHVGNLLELKKTIEFRQFPGTVDPPEIRIQVDFAQLSFNSVTALRRHA